MSQNLEFPPTFCDFRNLESHTRKNVLQNVTFSIGIIDPILDRSEHWNSPRVCRQRGGSWPLSDSQSGAYCPAAQRCQCDSKSFTTTKMSSSMSTSLAEQCWASRRTELPTSLRMVSIGTQDSMGIRSKLFFALAHAGGSPLSRTHLRTVNGAWLIM